MTQLIVIVSSDFTNSREICDKIKGQTFKNATAVRVNLLEQLLLDEEEESRPSILIYNIEDFVDDVNDQHLDVLTEDFITTVFVEE